MKPTIFDETVNNHIIKHIIGLGCNNFDENKTYEISYILDGKFKFNTQYWFENGLIKKDSEYYGTDIVRNVETEFTLKPPNVPTKTLQELFDILYEAWEDEKEQYIIDNKDYLLN